MVLEELIDKVTDIKKSLIELEEIFRDCEDIDEETYRYLADQQDCAYEDLIRIKDELMRIDFDKREQKGEDK